MAKIKYKSGMSLFDRNAITGSNPTEDAKPDSGEYVPETEVPAWVKDRLSNERAGQVRAAESMLGGRRGGGGLGGTLLADRMRRESDVSSTLAEQEALSGINKEGFDKWLSERQLAQEEQRIAISSRSADLAQKSLSAQRAQYEQDRRDRLEEMEYKRRIDEERYAQEMAARRREEQRQRINEAIERMNAMRQEIAARQAAGLNNRYNDPFNLNPGRR